MKEYDAIIFDFDGVIVDSFDIKNDAFKEIYKIWGVENDIDIKKGGVTRIEKFTYYHKKLLGKKIEEKELESLCDMFSDIVFQRIKNAKLIKGTMSVIRNNYQKKKLFVVSATPIKELEKLLLFKGLLDYFDGIYGSEEEKDVYLKEISKKFKRTIFIGDQESDYIAAKKANMDFVYVEDVKRMMWEETAKEKKGYKKYDSILRVAEVDDD